jgi:protein arginine N-methyltransferase 2
MNINPDYHNEKLTYTDDNLLLDSNGSAIMMGWEKNIMKHSAVEICKNGGDILNVGFGLGFIDNYIQKYNTLIKTHWIIESHPDVQEKMIKEGWLKKENVKVIFKPWQEVIKYLPKFDGIYFDTWLESQKEFDINVKNLLKPKGIYSFFNNPNGGVINNIAKQSYDILKSSFDIIPIEIPIKNDSNQSLKHQYFDTNIKTYFIPKCQLK